MTTGYRIILSFFGATVISLIAWGFATFAENAGGSGPAALLGFIFWQSAQIIWRETR